MKKFLTALTFCLLAMISKSQHESCGSATLHQQLIQSNPDYLKVIEENEKQVQAIIAKRKRSKTTETVYKVPVVVHVIHTGESVGVGTNLSDATIQAGIDSLNRAFRNQHGQSVDIKIEFELAKRDTNCNATSGIVRVDGTSLADYATHGVRSSGSTGPTDAQIKALSRWPNTQYYNIWIVSEFDNNNGGAGLQGYAYFPGASAAVDGTVLMANAYTGSAKTLIHEIGHAFNLYHTFEGDNDGASCPTGNQCGSGAGDCCGDTPPHIRSGSNCNSGGTNACDGGSSNANFVHNYMDYSSDACQYLFTSEQKSRMRAAMEGPRASLLFSKALTTTLPSFSMNAASCTPTTQADGLAGNYAGSAKVEIEGKLSVSSGSARTDGGYLNNANSCQSSAILELNTTYKFKVTTLGVNHQQVKAYIDWNNDGDFVDAGEEIFSNSSILNTVDVDSVNFTVPGTATTGAYIRMRVLDELGTNYGASPISGPCYNSQYGQAEDYVIYINPGSSIPTAAFSANKTTVCVGEAVTFNDASTNTPTGWSWNFTGGNPSTSTNQNQSVVYNTPGTYSVTLTATNASGSDDEVKNAYITVVANPTVALGNDTSFCSGNSVTLDAGNPGSSYSWSSGATSQMISASATGTYHVTVTNGSGCVGRDTINVTVHSLPSVSVNSAEICSGAAAATFTATAPTATGYVWSGNGTGTSSTTTGSTAGTYTVMVSDANGCQNSASGTLTVNQNPVVTVNSETICSGATATFTATVDSVVTTYLWSGQGSGTVQTTTGTTAGNYTVNITDVNGCSGSGTGVLTVNSLPAVSVNDSTICEFAGSATFTATAPTAVSYLWSGNGTGTGSTTSGFTAGSYTVTVTDGNGCQNSASGTLTVNSLPAVTVNDSSICEGGASATFTATAPTAVSYLWSNNGTGTGMTTTGFTAGSYTVTVTDANGCQNSANGTLAVNSRPVVNLGNDTTICGTVNYTLDAGAGYSSYEWYTPSASKVNSQTVIANQAGTYYASVTDANGCKSLQDTMTISASNPIVNLGNDTTFCGSGSTTLDAGAGFASYQWNTGATSQTIATSGAGDYSVTVTDLNGCQDQDTMTVSISNPVVDLGNDTSFCGTTNHTLDAGAFTSYLWSTGATSQTISVSASGQYHVTVTDAAGCQDQDTVNVTISDPIVTLMNDTSFCGDGTHLLDAGAGFSSYLWNTGATSQTITSSSNGGTYSVVVTDGNGCTDTDTTVITVANPVVDLGNDTSFCGTTNHTLDAGAFTSYLWSTGATSQTISISASGQYHVTVTDAAGCQDQDTVNVTISDPVVDLGNDTSICGTIAENLDAGSGFNSYLWSTGATSQTIIASLVGDYSVQVTDINGCTDTDTISISAGTVLVDLGPNREFCLGDSVLLNAGNPGATYSWNVGANSQTIVAKSTGTYRVEVTNGGCFGVDSVEVLVHAPPVITINGAFSTNYTVNQGDIALNFATPTGGIYSGTGVSFGQFNTATAGTGSHTIVYTYTDGNGCTSRDSLVLNVSPITSTTELTEESLTARPNPFKNQVELIKSGNLLTNYRVVDATGAVVNTGSFTQNVTLNTVEWAAGTYYLQVVEKTTTKTLKIVKTK